MNGEMTHDQVLELLPLYVLGVLDPEEMLAVDTYLQDHPELLSRLTEWEEVVAHLAYAAPYAPLPPDSGERLIRRLPANRIEPHSDSQQHPQPNFLRGFIERFLGFDRWALATASITLLLLLLGLYAFQLRRLNRELTAEIESLHQINSRLQEEINENRLLLARLSTSERLIPLPGTAEAPNAGGVFYVNGLEGHFVLNGLPPLASDQTYQLWLVPPGGSAPDAVPVGLVEQVSETGSAERVVSIPADLQDFAIVDVSLEPAGGSEHLSGPVVIRARIE
jgi:anti-sigma-K factor RskA